MAIDRAFNPKRKRTVKSFLAALRHDSFYLFLHRCTTGLVDLGDPANGCNWTVRTSQLGPDSIVYSAGIGRDITFEHALADKFGFKIVLMDPSPTGAETMKLPENQRPEFIYLEVALAGHNGKLVLSSPLDPEEGSWVSETSQSGSGIANAEMVTVKCETVSSLMKKYGHTHVDLLKIDIEGAEYDVLEAIIESGVHIRQIAVEFHNGVLPGIPRSLTIQTLIKLYRYGYRIVHKGGSNHTLYLAAEL